MRSPSPLLSAVDLELAIGDRTLFRGLSFEIAAGECWVILGRNGSGKTTLLHTLAGLRRPAGGRVLMQGTPLEALPRRELARQRGLLQQDSVDVFPATVLETVLGGRHPHLSRWGPEPRESHDIARAAIATVGMEARSDSDVRTLSGGERRRVALAALLAQAPLLYLLDEPSSHLDLHYQLELLDLLHRTVREDGKALLMVLHDLNLAARYADHLIVLDGTATRAGPASALLDADALSRLYGVALRAVGDGASRAFVPQRGSVDAGAAGTAADRR